MHICFIGQYPYKGTTAGGVGSFTQTLGRALVTQNVQVTVIALYPNIQAFQEEDEGVRIYWVNQQQWRAFNFLHNSYTIASLIRKIHRDSPIDIIESQEAGFAFLPKTKGIQYVIRMHGGHAFFSRVLGKKYRKFLAWQEQKSFQKADAIIAVSRYVLDETKRHLQVPENIPTQVICNPIDTLQFSPDENGHALPYQIAFAGRIVEKKGIRQLIDAVKLLLPDFPQLVLKVYGGDTTIDYGVSFQNLITAIMTTPELNAVDFEGEIPRNELPARLATADICVYPSHLEAMPIAWLEAMSMGKALIAGSPGPGPEVIDDGVNGLLCNPFDANDIADKIRYLFTHPEQKNAMAEQARKTVGEKYALPNIVQQNISFYQQLINRS